MEYKVNTDCAVSFDGMTTTFLKSGEVIKHIDCNGFKSLVNTNRVTKVVAEKPQAPVKPKAETKAKIKKEEAPKKEDK
jgi:hypothetical protein